MADITISDLNNDLWAIRAELSSAHSEMERLIADWARKKRAYRVKKAQIFLQAQGTIDARKAVVDIACESEGLAADMAEGMMHSMRQRISSLQEEMAALRTMHASHRAEMELAKSPEAKEPKYVPCMTLKDI